MGERVPMSAPDIIEEVVRTVAEVVRLSRFEPCRRRASLPEGSRMLGDQGNCAGKGGAYEEADCGDHG